MYLLFYSIAALCIAIYYFRHFSRQGITYLNRDMEIELEGLVSALDKLNMAASNILLNLSRISLLSALRKRIDQLEESSNNCTKSIGQLVVEQGEKK